MTLTGLARWAQVPTGLAEYILAGRLAEGRFNRPGWGNRWVAIACRVMWSWGDHLLYGGSNVVEQSSHVVRRHVASDSIKGAWIFLYLELSPSSQIG